MHGITLAIASSILLTSSSRGGIKIDLRYDYDTNGFFAQPGAKEAMRACADFFETILTDELAEINAATSGNSQNTWSARPRHPETGNTLVLKDLIVPENTVIIFLGSRNLGATTTGQASTGYSRSGFQPFFDNVLSRGQSGAVADPATDYSPWGGAISFDTTLPDGSPRVWNFSLTTPAPGATDFIGVACHELCHIFGIGSSNSWDDQVDEELAFQGPASAHANGGEQPMVQPDMGHWSASAPGPYQSKAFGIFGTLHGYSQRVLMNPSTGSSGSYLRVITDLDIAGLIDVGWQVKLPANETFSFGGNTVTFSFPTNSNFNYRLQSGDLVSPWADLGSVIEGDGSPKQLDSSVSPSDRGFFRLCISSATPAAAAPVPGFRTLQTSVFQQDEWHWSSKNCCPH